MTKSFALAYAQRGIRVNAICPGYIQGALIRSVFDLWPDREPQVRASTSMGRLGTAEEIAEAVVWLCSEAASFVTGSSMVVDGGYVAL